MNTESTELKKNADGGRAASDNSELLAGMTQQDAKAAFRFHATTEDEGTYDIGREALHTLKQIGLIEHTGGGYYRETDKMLEFLALNSC